MDGLSLAAAGNNRCVCFKQHTTRYALIKSEAHSMQEA